MAHVSASSTHHYLLRDYLATGGLDPDRDTNLCVMPPPQLVGHLEIDSLDGFCVGEPWNTLAMLERRGTIVAATTELKADHPEKVLAVTRPWFEKNRPVAESLVRATVRACDFCDDVANRGRLTEILAHRSYLSLDEAVISKSLSIDEWYRRVPRRPRFRSFARSATVPRLQDAEWIVRKMIRWGQLPRDVDAGRIAAASMVAEPYAEAVATLKTTAPEPAALVAGASE
jgi:ABC-type nitrate/sulfonate/bicarbonate transport system substrate-binding protein